MLSFCSGSRSNQLIKDQGRAQLKVIMFSLLATTAMRYKIYVFEVAY